MKNRVELSQLMSYSSFWYHLQLQSSKICIICKRKVEMSKITKTFLSIKKQQEKYYFRRFFTKKVTVLWNNLQKNKLKFVWENFRKTNKELFWKHTKASTDNGSDKTKHEDWLIAWDLSLMDNQHPPSPETTSPSLIAQYLSLMAHFHLLIACDLSHRHSSSLTPSASPLLIANNSLMATPERQHLSHLQSSSYLPHRHAPSSPVHITCDLFLSPHR